MTPERRSHPVERAFCWLLAPFVENWRGLSLTRFLAVACFAFVAHTVWHEERLSWVDFSILTLGVATAFGKKAFLAWVERTQTKVEGKDIRETVEVTVKGREDGLFQATP